MATLQHGSERVQKICDVLRNETLEPAKKEADAIVAEAKARAAQIAEHAEKEAQRLHGEAKRAIEQERNVFHSSLEQAAKQSVEALRQTIEQKLFNRELGSLLATHAADPKLVANLITAIVEALEKEGTAARLSAIIPQEISAKEVNALLGDHILKKLEKHTVELGDFAGGAQVKLLDKKVTIDISGRALLELLSGYVRKDFRKYIFGA